LRVELAAEEAVSVKTAVTELPLRSESEVLVADEVLCSPRL
jgi:hypothetical protein